MQEEILASIVVKVGHDDLERIGNLAVCVGGIAWKMRVRLLAQFATTGARVAAPDAYDAEFVAHFLATVKVVGVIDSRFAVVVLRS